MQIANNTRKNWGPKPRLMRWEYLGMVRPMLTYAAMIWGHRAPFHSNKFKRINRMAMNTVGSFPRSTPTAAMEIIMDVMPLELFCQQEALVARCRLNEVVDINWDGTSKNKTHSVSHLRTWANLMQQYGINPDNNDACSTVKWSAGFRVNHNSFNGESKHRSLTQFNVFTYGSRKDDRTGCGFAAYHLKRIILANHYRLPDFATVFQAEISAIGQAADALSAKVTHTLKHVKIFMDSQAALLARANPAKKVAWLQKRSTHSTHYRRGQPPLFYSGYRPIKATSEANRQTTLQSKELTKSLATSY